MNSGRSDNVPRRLSDGFLGPGATVLERLSEQEQTWAVHVGRRLRAEFSALVGALPSHERTGPGVERALGINRAVAYRIISALASEQDLDVLTRVPGVEGLRMCVASARQKLGAPLESVLVGAESAIDDFQALIRTGGGSHARLVARIRATADGLTNKKVVTPPGRREDVRRAMHDVVQALSGRSAVARMSVSIIRPCKDDPTKHEYVHARAYIGYVAASGGLPLVVASWVTGSGAQSPGVDYQNLEGVPLDEREFTGLLEDFCTMPVPIVTSRDTTGKLVQVMDQARAKPGEAMDAVIAYRLPRVAPLPSLDDPPIYLEVTTMTVPAQRMVSDLYVHRSMAVGCTPSVSLYLGRGSGGCDLIDRWHEQIDGSPVLGLLGNGLKNAHSSGWERHAELTRHVFAKLGWDPQEYVGYRCDETWPLWNCDYVVALDYRAHEGAEKS